jgi:hypothetical protein
MSTANGESQGAAEAARDFLTEALGMVKIQAELAQTYSIIGDRAGLRYATRNLVSYVKVAVATVREVTDETEQDP